jgi:hypothetical protein
MFHTTSVKKFYAQKIMMSTISVKLFITVSSNCDLSYSLPHIISICRMETVHRNKILFSCLVLGSHSDEYKDGCLLGCRLVQVYQISEVCTAYIIRTMNCRPDDKGSMELWNFGKLVQLYTVLQPVFILLMAYCILLYNKQGKIHRPMCWWQ